jgi:hypothetical protein
MPILIYTAYPGLFAILFDIILKSFQPLPVELNLSICGLIVEKENVLASVSHENFKEVDHYSNAGHGDAVGLYKR